MSNVKKLALLGRDVIAFYVALSLMILLRYGMTSFSEFFGAHILPFSFVFWGWIVVFYLNDLYRMERFRSLESIAKTLFISVGVSFTFSIGVFYLFGNFFKLTPKTNLIIFSALFFVLGYLWRSWIFQLFKIEKTRVAFFGNSEIFEETIQQIKERPRMRYEAAVWVKNPADETQEKLAQEIRVKGITLAVFHPSLTKNPKALDQIHKLLSLGVNVMNFNSFYEILFDKLPVRELDQDWFIENLYTYKPVYDKVKRAGEFAVGASLAIVFSPIMALVALVVKATSRGPAIYAQRRLGIYGREFTLYKFRTMRDDERGPLWTEEEDRRITPFGKILRFTHLDEFPQLWNVIKGDVSFTGPRPERVELAQKYAVLPHYDVRHIVKPGITGWAQINFRPSASLEEAYEKLCYDVFYIKNRSLILDLTIALKTLRYFWTRRPKTHDAKHS